MSFNPSKILAIKVKAEQMWNDSALSQDLKPQAEAAIVLKKNSTARFRELSDPIKKNTVIVTWIDPCGGEVVDCTTDCNIQGEPLSSQSQEYELGICKETTFSVNRSVEETNIYSTAEQVAVGLMRAAKVLDEFWARTALLKMSSYAGYNVHADPYTWDATDSTTKVPAAQYNLSMVANLMLDAQANKLGSHFYIDNGALWVPYTDAALNGGNADGKGGIARINQVPMNFDLVNFAAAGLTETTFAVSNSALAFVTRNKFKATPEFIAGSVQQIRFTFNSLAIPGVAYDVIMSTDCVDNEIIDSYKMITRGDIFLNPKSCPITVGETTVQRSGILSYTKVP